MKKADQIIENFYLETSELDSIFLNLHSIINQIHNYNEKDISHQYLVEELTALKRRSAQQHSEFLIYQCDRYLFLLEKLKTTSNDKA